jgi:hypothetical protein
MSVSPSGRAALVASVVATSITAPAAASAATPKPGFTQFAGCPNTTEVFTCQYAKINGGSFKFGNVTVPVTSPITLTGGVTNDFPGKIIFTSAGGLKSAPLKVPGGLTGVTGLSEKFLNLITLGANDVYAVPKLVGQATLSEDGQGFRLPISVSLKNPFLATSCSLGSAAAPIILNLTTGTTAPPLPNHPITGAGPNDVNFDPATGIINSNNATYVDNAFAVPGASGCGSYLGPINVGFINDLVNARVGLPAAAGKNTAIQSDVDIQIVGPDVVYGTN